MSWAKKLGRHSREEGTDSLTKEREVHNSHGLFVLYPIPEFHNHGSIPEADIVAVHGLNGTARKTWTDKETGKFWLEDFLPDAVPTARIMTFGYDSALAFSNSKAGIRNFATDLLNRIRVVRSSHEAKNRPLVFITHSLGGIVVKKALILANEAQEFYGNILQSTRGIIFMGTPHRGSDLVPWTLLLSNLINIASLGQGIRKELLRNIDKDSITLMDISSQFVHRATPLKIMSFTEQNIERPLTKLVVPENSAVLGLPNEMIVPLNAHHRGMCRFPSNRCQNYSLVEAAIKEIVLGKPTSKAVVSSTKSPTSTGQVINPLSNFHTSTGDSRFGPGLDPNPQRRNLSRGSITGLSNSPSLWPRSVPSELAAQRDESYSRESNTKISTIPALPLSRSTQLRDNRIQIRISGLRKKLTPTTYGTQTVSRVLNIPSDTLVTELGLRLIEEQPDIKYAARRCTFSAYGHEIRDIWTDVFTTQVQVTTGRPCYDRSRGLKINDQQSIASFFSKAFPSPIEAKLTPSARYDDSTPFCKVASASISVGKGNNTYLHISFMRTVRIPEDGKNYDLPPNLGTFPLFNIQPFSDRLPPSIVAQGGLFLPMYQMEAMWINFDCIEGRKFIIRPFLGGVNGISGEGTVGDMGSLIRRMNRLTPTQDYIVLPEQMWLDGISTSPGIVKQFVATEMAPPRREISEGSRNKPGSRNTKSQIGASIEWQVTRQDSVGGIQLQIIPMFDVDSMFAGSIKNVCRSSLESRSLVSYDDSLISEARSFNVLNAPIDEGLHVGDVFHIKNMNSRLKERPKAVRDLLDEAPIPLTFRDVVEVRIQYANVEKCGFRVQVPGHLRPAIFLEFEVDDGFEDVVAVVQDKLGGLDGSLCMCLDTKTTPNTLLPVKSWSGFRDVYRYLTDVLRLEKSHLGRQYPYEWDFVWAPSKDNFRHLCSIWDLTHCKERHNTGNPGNPFLIALERHSTIRQLRREIEKATGSPTAQYAIKLRGKNDIKSDAERVFSSDIASEESRISEFLLCHISTRRPVQIFVENLEKTTVLIVELSYMVEHLRCAIQDKEGTLHQHRLLFCGRVLQDGLTLYDYDIREGSTLRVLYRMPGGGGPVTILVLHRGKTLAIKGVTVGDVKLHFLEEEGIPIKNQTLTYKGRVLDDG